MHLTETFERIIKTAERRYGPRCKGWTFEGIRYHVGPPVMRYAGPSAVAIYLGQECQDDPAQAIYQLSHEVVHLLSPAGEGSTVLEEGIAADFAVANLLDERGSMFAAADSAYKAAMRLYQRLERLDYHIVRKMRVEQPTIFRIDADLIRRHCPQIDKTTAQQLTERFSP